MAMSSEQWAAIQHGDESYAGSPSWVRFREALTELTRSAHHPHPPGSGRGEDPVLGGRRAGQAIPNNTHFDTTRANIEFTGAEAVDLVIAEGATPLRSIPSRATWISSALEVPRRAPRPTSRS